MIYLDTSALLKLVQVESETGALVEWLRGHPDEPLATSTVAEVELPRALRRRSPQLLGQVSPLLSRLYRVEMSAAVRATAAAYTEPTLRSLDAVHLATAEELVAAGQVVAAFVVYDARLSAAAEAAGLPTAAPAPA